MARTMICSRTEAEAGPPSYRPEDIQAFHLKSDGHRMIASTPEQYEEEEESEEEFEDDYGADDEGILDVSFDLFFGRADLFTPSFFRNPSTLL